MSDIRDDIMISSGEKLLALVLPFLGVLDVLLTTIVFLRQGELLTERNPIIKIITGSQNYVIYYIWSVIYVLFLAILSKWLVYESYREKREEKTLYGRFLKKITRDPKSNGQYDSHHFYVVLYSCLVGLYEMIIATNSFVVFDIEPTFLDNLVIYVMSLFITASVAYYLTKTS